MDQPKPFASLTPTLLARKGAAKPAMRPQLLPLTHFHENAALRMDALEDLGWNDHGDVHDERAAGAARNADIVPINGRLTAAGRAAVPEVVRQLADANERLATGKGTRRSALADGRRAAFTLRLDAERHLRLRLACTIANRSAQQLVTEALDRLIAETPDVASLARQVRKRT
ncbi:MAG: hypothetical protein M0R03_14775 [Novosphingobium sp.]|nr:hypothetical protein [Novosphingobium sp.]